MELSSEQITHLLESEALLKAAPNSEFKIEHLAYNSNDVTTGTLLFIKGNFKSEYLQSAIEKGVRAIVAPSTFEQSFEALPTWVVDDVAMAMSVVSMAFYEYPQNQLALIGITGTKGKTSAAYMAYEILSASTDNKVALSSTLSIITGNAPEYHYRAHLTTPESLDLYRYMREAVNNGMTHMVMEVSSQAYKMQRVYGLRYNVGIFLNISPDHVGENEHPTFEDYLQHKMMLIDHSEQIILNVETQHFHELIERAALDLPRDGIWLYGSDDERQELKPDIAFETLTSNLQGSTFRLREVDPQAKRLNLVADYQLDMPGDFNESNATAVAIATRLVGADVEAIQTGLATVRVPGRMQMLTSHAHGTIYVDYAHNYASITALLQFVRQNESVDRLMLVVGAPGNKGVSRRPGIGKAANEGADIVYLTSDDPQYEDPNTIADEIQAYITRSDVKVMREMDRQKAIAAAITAAGPRDVVVLAAKGLDEYQKVNGVDTPYKNDWQAACDIIDKLEK
ncbi:UDP-N-acetylmuramyl-tripeptide synthetase [Weissella diestrammenae]|uniref:UDP-N-acetylmuramyl-tripeptide synthetase n=1 Tax=Weissella diestrammenae TaxID=1162633 RepID=A0A7G9T531_9LACO|nr:UDP-N-acetylmuramyl-tripeptide synthetase [Weissella diestrammenae]MCM0583060.1 UDP-N-acetylmuramyl-tripeptide synthetase [Weissella diestrammenae]QNN75206.1 UDP-N-acetylmuramyl-tripeptide synthetase [Weissella diestrammenae]